MIGLPSSKKGSDLAWKLSEKIRGDIYRLRNQLENAELERSHNNDKIQKKIKC